ncbi:MAG: spheroidene monooxygenase, partial [Boseongicola sp.]|nr:spheroidene monooxygenase [Boseongicola sp.]
MPNTQVWAILAVWDDEETARAQVEEASVFKRWRAKASESWTVYLSPSSVRGHWSGQKPFDAAPRSATERHSGPLAALTRATIKPSTAAQFWRRVPDISSVIGADPNVMFKIGIGEVPLLHQVT